MCSYYATFGHAPVKLTFFHVRHFNVIPGEAQVELMMLIMAQFNPSVPVSNGSETAHTVQGQQNYQNYILLLITVVHLCFPVMTCQNICCEKVCSLLHLLYAALFIHIT